VLDYKIIYILLIIEKTTELPRLKNRYIIFKIIPVRQHDINFQNRDLNSDKATFCIPFKFYTVFSA